MGFNLEQLVERRPAENVPVRPPQNADRDGLERAINSAPPAPVEEQRTEPQPIVEEDNPAAQPPVTKKAQSADNRNGKEKRSPPPDRSPVKASNDPNIRKKKIEVAVDNAIQNRAIDGVSVSFVDGTVYLDGEVATERQKAMAERAARSVPEVKQVRNRLSVKFS
jgi:hypothetical protein